MRIAIVGGTGTLGRRVAEELRSRGHDARVISRKAPQYRVDLTTGEGLDAALAGCDAVVDASNDSSSRAAQTLVEGSRRLLAAEAAAGVRHHVCVSVVGCERVPLGYFRVKAEQERAAERGAVPWSIVRATQFHEIVATSLAAAGRWGILPLPRGLVQPIASAEVARAVAAIAEGEAQRRRVDVAGPERVDLRALARAWRAGTGRRTLLIPIPLPGKVGRALRGGALTCERPEVRGAVTFGEWLAQKERAS